LFEELKELKADNRDEYNARSISSFGRKKYEGRGQEDAADYLNYLIVEMNREMKGTDCENLIRSIFSTETFETMKCRHCENSKELENTEGYIVHVNINDKGINPIDNEKRIKSVDYALKMDTFGTENVDGWHCPDCRKNVNGSKEKIVFMLPNALILQLVRFTSNGRSTLKNTEKVTFNFDLELQRNTDDSVVHYQLSGLVMHIHGEGNREESNLNELGGHYVAYVKVRSTSSSMNGFTWKDPKSNMSNANT
jgi:ubiquitin C-terminal hydrolase